MTWKSFLTRSTCCSERLRIALLLYQLSSRTAITPIEATTKDQTIPKAKELRLLYNRAEASQSVNQLQTNPSAGEG